MNSHRDRIYHFKDNPREIGFAAGQTLAGTLEQTIRCYIVQRPGKIARGPQHGGNNGGTQPTIPTPQRAQTWL
jgi:hypothetical protein